MLSFSVIIPTFRRPEQLRRLLAFVAEVDFPLGEFEVIVVDDGGGESLRDLAQERSLRLLVRFVPQSHLGPATARNTGAIHARAPYLCFIDDDCRPDVQWLTELWRQLQLTPNAGVGGQVVNELGSDSYSQASQDLVEYLYEYYNTPNDARFFTTNNLALPTARFLEMGGFDTSFPLAAAEDRDLCERWRERGWDLVYQPKAVVLHAHRMNFRGFVRQHFTYGRGAVYLHQARDRRGRPRPRLESARFYLRLLTTPLRRSYGLRTPLMLFLAVLTQVAYGVGYYWERWRASATSPRSGPPGTDKLERRLSEIQKQQDLLRKGQSAGKCDQHCTSASTVVRVSPVGA